MSPPEAPTANRLRDTITARLAAAGLSPAEAQAKGELFVRVDAALADLAGAAAEEPLRLFVPGRIEVLGKHTDYAGGRSLLCAAGRGFCVAAAPRAEPVLRVADAARGLAAEVPIDAALTPSAGDWTIYAQAVAGRLARDFPGPLRGADVALASDLPRAAGLSSSSALVVALALVLIEVNRLRERPEWEAGLASPEELADYLGCVENGRSFPGLGDGAVGSIGGVGALTGGEDHTAILCCRAGEIAQYRFCPVRHEASLPLDPSWSFVVAASGVASDKTGGVRDRYNRLSRATSAILDLWNRAQGTAETSLHEAATRWPEARREIAELLHRQPVPGFAAGFLIARLAQLLEESEEIIPAVAAALAHGEVEAIGAAVDRSQELAEQVLGNQLPETVALQRSARELGGAAASAFGGGFGGSVWALVQTDTAADFQARWSARYAAAFPEPARHATFFVTRPGPPTLPA